MINKLSTAKRRLVLFAIAAFALSVVGCDDGSIRPYTIYNSDDRITGRCKTIDEKTRVGKDCYILGRGQVDEFHLSETHSYSLEE